MSSDAALFGWVVCGNITDHLRGGSNPDKFYQGTKMFSPGTKVYLGDAYWGMGGQNIHAVGLRRISREFVNCVIDIGAIENLRITSVYSASLWRKLEKLNAELFKNKEDADDYFLRCSHALKNESPAKLASVERWRPWGSYVTNDQKKKTIR